MRINKVSAKVSQPLFQLRTGKSRAFLVFMCLVMFAVGASIAAGRLTNASASFPGLRSFDSPESSAIQEKVSRDTLWEAVDEKSIIVVNQFRTQGASSYRTMSL